MHSAPAASCRVGRENPDSEGRFDVEVWRFERRLAWVELYPA